MPLPTAEPGTAAPPPPAPADTPAAAAAPADPPPPPPGTVAEAASEAPDPALAPVSQPAPAAAPPPPPPPPPAAAAPAPAAAAAPPPPPLDPAAAAPSPTAVATTSASPGNLATSGGGMVSALAQEGFEGMDLGFGSFPIVSLQNDGSFSTSDGRSFGHYIDGIVMGSRAKYVVKNGLPNDNPDQTLYYTYDHQQTSTGRSCEEIQQFWRSKGWNPVTSNYLELQFQLHGGENSGQVILVSVAPSSVRRASGYMVQLVGKYGSPDAIRNVVTRIQRGEKVTNVQWPFYPFAFVELGSVAE